MLALTLAVSWSNTKERLMKLEASTNTEHYMPVSFKMLRILKKESKLSLA